MVYLPSYCCNLDGGLRSLLDLVVMVVVMGVFYGEFNCLLLPRLLAASRDHMFPVKLLTLATVAI
jgi:hypothetical protein